MSGKRLTIPVWSTTIYILLLMLPFLRGPRPRLLNAGPWWRAGTGELLGIGGVRGAGVLGCRLRIFGLACRWQIPGRLGRRCRCVGRLGRGGGGLRRVAGWRRWLGGKIGRRGRNRFARRTECRVADRLRREWDRWPRLFRAERRLGGIAGNCLTDCLTDCLTNYLKGVYFSRD